MKKKNTNFVQTCLVQGEKENREKFSGEDGTQEELEDNFAERISFGQRRRKAGTEVKSLVGEGDETFFGIQVCNVCISHKTKPVEMLGRCF